jgi:hypothetical protein
MDRNVNHKNQEDDLWAKSHFKIYLENIPEDITMDGLLYAMRNCGDIADAKLYMNRYIRLYKCMYGYKLYIQINL